VVRVVALTQTDQELLEAVEQGVLEHQQELAAVAHRLNRRYRYLMGLLTL
jgi:hypothetical protein